MDHLDTKQLGFVIYFGLHMHHFQKYCLSKLFTFFLQKWDNIKLSSAREDCLVLSGSARILFERQYNKKTKDILDFNNCFIMDEQWMDKYENMKNNNEMMVYNG